MANIIAIATYGSHRVKHPQTKQTVSAYKLGYTTATSAILLALYRDQARDVSSRHATYHYVQIMAETTVHHGYLLLKVTDDELAQAKTITKRYHRSAVYRWMGDEWREFPNNQSTDYQRIIGHSGLEFNPMGRRIVSASTGTKESASPDTITAEQDNGWWWLRGDTYPHREMLKRWGCRWSKKRRAWYYMDEKLPDAVQALLTTSDDAPCTDEEAQAMLGVPLKPPAKPETPPLFAVDDTVYARHELMTSNDLTVKTGSKGIVTKVYNRNPKHGWSYDVQFDVGVGWFVEDELTKHEMPPNIRITKGEIIPQPDPPAPEAKPSPIQIIKPALDDDLIQTIRGVKTDTLPNPNRNHKRHLATIPQTPCGELTGSITGDVWCYGWAVHQGVCVYLNMGGPRMAVEAIRAKLVKGDQVSCVPYDTPSVELTAGEGNTGMYTAFTQNIPEAKFTSMILLYKHVTEPNYGGKSTTFILQVSDEQAMAQLHHHVTQLVYVPVFIEWTSYLWQAGQSAMLVRKTRGAGGLDVLVVDLDVDAWTRLITGGLATDVIQFPVKHGGRE